MAPHTSRDVHAYARWLTQECRAAGLNAEHHGETVLVVAADHHLSERITCGPDEYGDLRWRWSWGTPITAPCDRTHVLKPDDVDELVAAIARVVAIEVRPR